MATRQGAAPRSLRVAAALLLGFVALFYLQFGLQALAHHVLQGLLALVGAVALGWGALRICRRQPASSIVFLGTLPLFLFHVWFTVKDPGEMPFLIGSAPAPALAGVAWLISRRP